MAPEHAGARVAHHLPDLFAPLRLVTVNRAFCAGRFLRAERAMLGSLLRIDPEGLAFIAQGRPAVVMPAAVQADHPADRLKLAPDAAHLRRLAGHGLRLSWSGAACQAPRLEPGSVELSGNDSPILDLDAPFCLASGLLAA